MADRHDARLAELVGELGGDDVRFLFRDLVQKALQELVDFIARDDGTSCLTEGGWRTMGIYDRNPEPDIEGDVEREDLLVEPVYVHDIEVQP